MEISAIRNQDELKAVLLSQEARIGSLEKQLEKEQTEAWQHKYSGKGGGFDDKAAASLGDLAKALGTGDQIRALKWEEKNGVREKTLGTPLYSDSVSGSYLVTAEIENAVKYVSYQNSQLISLVDHTSMNTYQKKLPVAVAMPSLTTNANQSTANTEVDPTFSQVTLTAYTVACFIPLTSDFLEDSSADVGQYLMNALGSYMGYWWDNTILNATGTPWTGILAGAATFNYQLAAGKVNFTDLAYDDLVSMLNRITTERFRRNGKYIIGPTAMAALRTRKNAMGDYLLREGVSSGARPTFLGYDVVSTDGAPATSAPNTKFGAFLNPGFFTVGDRLSLEIKLFDQTQNAVQNNVVYYRARMRVGGSVTIPDGVCTVSTAGN